MKYIACVVLPMLFQCLVVFIIIHTNTGNGSWAGLAASLIGMFAIPATGVANFIIALTAKDLTPVAVTTRCFLVAIIAPFLVTLVMVFG